MMTTAKPYVLVVDDSSDGREMLAEYLTFRGLSVIEAANGETAIDLVHKHRPALILMDLQMPGIGGWDATRQLKANPATRDIIVIAMTARVLAPDEGIARQAGCDGFIAKPYDITAVADATIEVLVRGRDGLAVLDRLNQAQSQTANAKKSAAT
ncbi:MAG TPA: response regulator [Vicinamibacterales bacterium]|nr:response regulator [Vicinamibacterales bacterium]